MLDGHGEFVNVLGRWPVQVGESLSYRAATAPSARLSAVHRSMLVANASEEFPQHAPFAGAARTYLGSAIMSSAARVLGVIEIWDEQPFVAGPESRQILEMFAHRIGAELDRAAVDRELRQLTASLESRIAARTSELAHANQELEAFSYSVSHDLRAPVRAIDAHAAMLVEKLQDSLDGPGRSHLERILEGARRMRELIDGLLALARLAHHSLAIESVDLGVLARQAMDLLQERDRTRQVQFRCPDSLSARADRTGASVIITNLLENAWKYSSRVDRACIEFGAEHRDGEIVYLVRDNGVGFDMQHAKHLFEPFRRLHTQGEYPGSGIGLATVARIVHRHGGRVWAQSAPGQGTTFYFTLQRREGAAAAGLVGQMPAPAARVGGSQTG
jgi:signal transduction histidine kinase